MFRFWLLNVIMINLFNLLLGTFDTYVAYIIGIIY